ncbi:MAG: YHYH protein [Rhodoferax sp.]|nr:YHYH protein [Rhodoferax sp.]
MSMNPTFQRAIAGAFVILLSACGGSASTTNTDGTTNTTNTNTNTTGVACDYSHNALNTNSLVNLTSIANWSCTSSKRQLSANGVPDHDVGPFAIQNDLDFKIAAQSVSFSTPIAPVLTTQAQERGGPRGDTGMVLNGVKIDPGTAGTCNDSGETCTMLGQAGQWRMEALGQTSFNFGADGSNAHVQPGGIYHYHGIPEGFIQKLGKGKAMTLIGWAADGFPIYARYGFTEAGNAASAIKVMQSSYRKKSAPDANRPATSKYPMGTFSQDYEYVAGLGDLDECNGRTGVTPEFPKGIYHYFATETFPYLQRCVKGTL